MTGRLRFYDLPTAWGVVVGDDGQLYMMHGQPTSGAPLRVGERVRFEPALGPGGPRATGVQRLDTVKGASGARTSGEWR